MKKNRTDEFIKHPKRSLFRLALPLLVGMMVQTLYNIVDTAFVGRLGADAIAALTFSFPIFFILMAMNSGMGTGMGSRIARLLGEKSRRAAENAAMHGILIAVVTALVMTTFGLIFLEPIFILMGASGNVLSLSTEYMSIILAGAVFMFLVFIFNSIFTSQGDTKTPMKVQITALVLNIILDPILIYGLDMGVRGAAVATVIALLAGLAMFIYYSRTRSYLRIRRNSFMFSLNISKEIIRVGLPASLTMLLMSVYMMFINRLMTYFGTDYVAVFGLAFRLESLEVMPVVAFSLSLLTVTGMFYGAKRHDLLKGVYWYSVKIGLLISSGVGLVFFLFPEMLFRIFTSDPSLLDLGAVFLRFYVFTFPFHVVAMITSRAMQGMGKGMPGMIINMVRSLFIAVPLAYVLVFVFGFGYLSVPAAMIVGGMVSTVIAIVWIEVEFKRLNHRSASK
ncbi:MATE family efflux transporter [Candidatus Woesearchaeota archaeon]|nr:MATE family efflux transporter [Candidatus Woesearchaeota archaeon]